MFKVAVILFIHVQMNEPVPVSVTAPIPTTLLTSATLDFAPPGTMPVTLNVSTLQPTTGDNHFSSYFLMISCDFRNVLKYIYQMYETLYLLQK